MTQLTIRRLLIDLETPVPARWLGGDAFKSAWFNAMSMSFPTGEQYFIDSVRNGLKKLPPELQEKFATEVQGFIGQEATHRRIHDLFNAHLERQGYTNWIDARAKKRIAQNAHYDHRLHLAATAATEHFTAVFADWTHRHPEVLAGAEPRLQTLWMWHAAEESEHRSTAFDLYVAAGGNHKWRLRTYRYITVMFLSDVAWQTVRNLHHDGALFKRGTWVSAARFLFGKTGIVRSNVAAWRAYFSPNFHPSQQDAALSAQWLHDHADQYALVGQKG
jgi:predicted metal-dependent hydrolase